MIENNRMKFFFQHCQLAKVFAQLLNEDNRFEIIGDVRFGLVCFRIKVNSIQKEFDERIHFVSIGQK